MSTEPITGLTYQEAGSLQTDAVQNAELNFIGAWLNCVVLSVGDNDPPGSPAEGDCYIVGDTPTGAWATHADDLAVYRGGWQFFAPKEGVAVKNMDDGDDYEYVSAAWTVKAGGGGGGGTQYAQVMLSDMDTALTTGTGKAIWFAPEPGTLVDVWIAVGTVSSSGVVRIDMNDSGGSVFTTRPSIDASENTSLIGTAAVLDGTVTFAKGDIFTFDIDDAGTGAKALMVTVEYEPTA